LILTQVTQHEHQALKKTHHAEITNFVLRIRKVSNVKKIKKFCNVEKIQKKKEKSLY